MANFLKKWFTGLTTGTVQPTALESNLQDRLIAIEERLALEHQTFNNSNLDSSLATAPGRHIPGAVSVCHYGTSAPSSPTQGSIWYDSTSSTLKVYNGTTWYAQTVPTGVPSGTIVMWDSTSSPPTGWSWFTKLSYKFPMGVYGGTYPLGSTLSASGPSLTHSHPYGSSAVGVVLNGGNSVAIGVGTQNTTLNVPFYAINFIIKD